MVETNGSHSRGRGFESCCHLSRDPFSSNIHLNQSGFKNMLENRICHSCRCYNLANGRVDIEERLGYKTQLFGFDLNESL